MPLTLLKPEQVERAQAALRAEMSRVSASQPRTRLVNTATVRLLDGALRAFEYRGVAYVAKVVPYPTGIDLEALKLRVDALADAEARSSASEKLDALEELFDVMVECVALFPTLVVPRNPLLRLPWRLGWMTNPFRTATQQEVAELLGFFSLCRMKSSIRLPETPAAVTPPTPSTTSPSSRASSPRGSGRTGSRFRTRTTG